MLLESMGIGNDSEKSPENKERENPFAGLKLKLHPFEDFENRQSYASSKD